MSAQISLKNSLLMLLAGVAFSTGMAFLLSFLFSGPKLGAHYDFLLGYKPPVVSNEILIIDTDEFVEGGDFFSVLMTLTEMEASNLILTGRLSPSTTPITVNETEIRRRFSEEYAIAGSNIRNLFEGIRMGYVTARQAPVFVERLVEITEQGRDRLLAALIDRDEDLIRSVAVFGNFLEGYTKIQVDNDGKLRRVMPIDMESSVEHPVYFSLKNRYAVSQIETADELKILWLRGHDGKNIDIPLDRDGNIITAWNCNFSRIDIDLFRRYQEAGYNLHDIFEQANELGVFSSTLPEQSPLFLGDYAQELLDELLRAPDAENRTAWIASRADYFKSLNAYFTGSAEAEIIGAYEDLIMDMDPSRRELENLINTKNELESVFALMRETYNELSALHSELKNNLTMSLCIMGPSPNAEYSALLANTLITGSHIKPVSNRYVIFWSILISFIILLIVFTMRPLLLLILGSALCVLSALIYSGIFIFYSYWLDPVVVFGSSLTGMLVVFYCRFIYLNIRTRNFRNAYRTAVPKNILANLINSGRPRLSEITVAFASVIVIKDINLLNKESREKPDDAGKLRKAFFSLAKKAVFNAGAIIAGYEGDSVIACFGSPLETQPSLATHKWSEEGEPIAKSYHPIDKACSFVRRLLKNEKITWRFGIDAGECTFSWAAETGFTVNGRPAVRARILAAKTSPFHVRALISDSVRAKLELVGHNIEPLKDDDPVYELPPE
jgi:hypothetical protein